MSKLDLGASFLFNTDYSTSEIKTGATWMSKPVYCKIVECAYGSTAGTGNDTNHNIPNISTIVKIDGYTSDNHPYFFPVNFATIGVYSECFADRTLVRLVTNSSGLFGRTARVVLYYTKTTD